MPINVYAKLQLMKKMEFVSYVALRSEIVYNAKINIFAQVAKVGTLYKRISKPVLIARAQLMGAQLALRQLTVPVVYHLSF